MAVKLEPVKANYPQLYYESKLYKILMGGRGIPSARYVVHPATRLASPLAHALRVEP